MHIEVTEVVPGEVDVALQDGRRCRVLIPAGVGIPGADDTDLAGALLRVLLDRGEPLPDVIDASRRFASDPHLLAAVDEVIGRESGG